MMCTTRSLFDIVKPVRRASERRLRVGHKREEIDMTKRSPTLQQFLHDNGVTRDEKQIRRFLRSKFKSSHEHNARWMVTAPIAKALRSHFARDFENARKRREAAKAKTTAATSA